MAFLYPPARSLSNGKFGKPFEVTAFISVARDAGDVLHWSRPHESCRPALRERKMRKIIIIGIIFVALLLIGTFGYMLLENTGFWMGLYLTIITVFTVGYGDIVPVHDSGRIFTVFLVITSVSFVFYVFSKITETMIEGELRGLYKRRKMHRQISRLKEHYIICGFGRIGKEICRILQEYKRPFVVIEKDPVEIKNLEELQYLHLQGDASDDEVLLGAGIGQARGLVSVVASDADNLYITLTARGLSPQMFIMARSSGTAGAQIKLKRAGATRVISPYSIGARRMAHLIVRPTVTDFIDLTMRAGELDLIMEELLVSPDSRLVDKNLIDSEIRKKYDVIVVAIKRQDGSMLFNPRPDTIILAGDILIVLGASEHIAGLGREM